jgi:hypothetical protein
MSEKLKPCPFCGGEAEAEWIDGAYVINCMGDCNIMMFIDTASIFVATKAWNTRHKERE